MPQFSSKNAVISALKQLRFVQQTTETGNATDYDKSQVTFPTQAAGEEFLSSIPPQAQKELGLKIIADMSTGTSAVMVNHMAYRRLMAIDFASYVGASQQPSGAV